mmetsp:Transcript_32659/g.45545  ORF Transcript_32659/g.45545 Transcript_32659/m.45545 type:complete len:354 (+) Transcript_32659:121-1182(+)|eukprot:CAMPEP_0185256606 /NCGR_PEP_ID=MMETSP1359-20130426/5695_1 /TAXON_ID=552665 /ORGANISM="Bigelowiella longifila, Strain CCMP242" /LENGTH=353 /DNA_ID=CAMNT_0027841263 /DNA_START=64 /DNA_END=1125 /DNA_ORIENTATION=+
MGRGAVLRSFYLLIALGSTAAHGPVRNIARSIRSGTNLARSSGKFQQTNTELAPSSIFKNHKRQPMLVQARKTDYIQDRDGIKKGRSNSVSHQPLAAFNQPSNQMALMGLMMLAALLHTDSAHALDVFDNDWVSQFKVDFAGFEIDHRVLVEGVVGGQFVGFIGALVGGRAAKKRKDEVEKLAKQLKDVNAKLRAKARTMRRQKDQEVKDPLYERVFGYLRMGKRTLKEKNGEAALSAFQKAMQAIKEAKQAGSFNNFMAERKCHRGLGAAQLLLGNYPAALEHLEKVVEISLANNENTGVGDAYGAIADIYTEANDFENAAIYYDKYIEAINDDIQTSEDIELDEEAKLAPQ